MFKYLTAIGKREINTEAIAVLMKLLEIGVSIDVRKIIESKLDKLINEL